jgi:putative transposase
LGLIDHLIDRTMNPCRVASTTERRRRREAERRIIFLRGLLKTND